MVKSKEWVKNLKNDEIKAKEHHDEDVKKRRHNADRAIKCNDRKKNDGTSEKKLYSKKQKTSEKRSKSNHQDRTNGNMSLELNNNEFGKWYVIKQIPHTIMSLIVTHFKNEVFLKPFGEKGDTIVDPTDRKAKAKYWLLGNTGVNVERSSWESCHYLHEGHRAVLMGMHKMLKDSLYEQLGIVYEHFIPGFVVTNNAEHQMLHVDNKQAIEDEDGTGAMIVHIPLHPKGMWLRVGLIQDTSLNDQLLFIPFGSGIILPQNQFHGGHYGDVGNLRFHCILSKQKWDGRNLFYIDTYLKEEKVCNNFQELIDQEKERMDQDIVYKEASKTHNFRPATYYNNLVNQCNSPAFLNLLNR